MFSLPLLQIQEGKLSVAGKSMFSQYCLTSLKLSLFMKNVSRLTDQFIMVLIVLTGKLNSNSDNPVLFKTVTEKF